MKGRVVGVMMVGGLARVLLRYYPASFRRSHGEAFVEAARHRWQKERARRGWTAAVLGTAVWLRQQGAGKLLQARRHAE